MEQSDDVEKHTLHIFKLKIIIYQYATVHASMFACNKSQIDEITFTLI